MTQRQIKFRAWNKLSGQWVNPSFYGDILVGGDEVAIVNNRPHNGGYTLDSFTLFNHTETDALEISQFTGLLDKNGKEIYEGDILTGMIPDSSVDVFFKNWQVEWQGGGWAIVSSKGYEGDLCSASLNQCIEIVGNIYKTPELLKCLTK